jgi:hypothetical protein
MPVTKHNAVHKLHQAAADLHHALKELEGLDKYMTDEHYATRKERTAMFLRNAKNIIFFTVDAGLGKDLIAGK